MKDKTMSWLYRVPGRKKGLIAALAAVQAVTGATGVLYALLLRNIVNSAVAHDGGAFRRYVLFTVLLVCCQLALHAVIRWLSELSKSTLENTFKQRLTDTLLRKEYASVSSVHSGEWLNRLTNDTVVAANGYVEILPGLAGMAVRLVSALIVLIALDRIFALVLLPGGLLLALLTYAFRKALKRLHRQMQESDGRLRIFLQERIGSLMIVKAFGAENRTALEAAEKMRAHQGARMRKNRFSNLCGAGFGAAMHGMYLFGIIYCAYGILTGTQSYGTLIAVMQLVGQIQTPFASISGFLPRWYAMTASAERLMEAEQFAEETATLQPLSAPEISECYHRRFESLCFRDARFSYPGEETLSVPEGFDLEIRKGETVAFTGHSGCGKSTALKLMMALYPLDSGQRVIRFIDGAERTLTAAFRRLFAYVPQGSALMNGTIREVVSFADPAQSGDEERLRRALRIACAEEFAYALENGPDSELGERGSGLSEGQMQRLAIARAIFADSPILLLDEATSALDEDTEKRLLENLRRLTDKTVVIVTHRPAVLSICDRVLHFTENGVVES